MFFYLIIKISVLLKSQLRGWDEKSIVKHYGLSGSCCFSLKFDVIEELLEGRDDVIMIVEIVVSHVIVY